MDHDDFKKLYRSQAHARSHADAFLMNHEGVKAGKLLDNDPTFVRREIRELEREVQYFPRMAHRLAYLRKRLAELEHR